MPKSMLQRSAQRGAAIVMNSMMKENSEEKKETPFQKIKKYGLPGLISWIVWKMIFSLISVVGAPVAFYYATGRLPDLFVQADLLQLSASAAAFVGVTSFLAPIRIALTIATTVWADKNIAKNPWFIKNVASRFKKPKKEVIFVKQIEPKNEDAYEILP